MDVTRPVASINASTRTLPETCWLLASIGYVGGTEKISLAGLTSPPMGSGAAGAVGCLLPPTRPAVSASTLGPGCPSPLKAMPASASVWPVELFRGWASSAAPQPVEPKPMSSHRCRRLPDSMWVANCVPPQPMRLPARRSKDSRLNWDGRRSWSAPADSLVPEDSSAVAHCLGVAMSNSPQGGRPRKLAHSTSAPDPHWQRQAGGACTTSHRRRAPGHRSQSPRSECLCSNRSIRFPRRYSLRHPEMCLRMFAAAARLCWVLLRPRRFLRQFLQPQAAPRDALLFPFRSAPV